MRVDVSRACSVLIVVCVLLVLSSLAPSAASQTPTGAERVSAGLKEPVDLAFGQDGYIYFASLTERRVLRVDAFSGVLDEDFRVQVENATWQPRTETGVFGLALRPDFRTSGVLYVSYSQNESGTWQNVLSRVTLLDRNGGHREEVLMVRPGGQFHNGGRILVAGDRLWWTTGDATDPYMGDPKVHARVAQEDGVMRGKILRLDLDGAPAPDNPWGDAAFTRGHRNVYGIAWDPVAGRALVTENGNARSDELNLLVAGGDYGWPECEGRCAEPRPDLVEPVYWTNGTVAPTGVAWFRGAFWFGTFNQGDVLRATDASGLWEVTKVHHYGGNERFPPRVLDVEAAPDGSGLWFSTWDELWYLPFADDPAYPPPVAALEGPVWWEGAPVRPAGPSGDGKDADAPAVAAVLLGLCVLLVARWGRRQVRH